MNAYKEVCQSSWTQMEAWERTIKHKAPRFYVSPKQAYYVLSPVFFHGDRSKLDSLKPSRRRMYECLYNVVLELSQKPSFVGMSLWKLMPYAVAHEAPEFFVDWELIRKVFRWTKKGVINGTVEESK